MSYSNFEYSELKLNKNKMKDNEKINVTVKIENKSNYAGYEVIQLYIQDLFGSVVRPIKELKDFKKEFFNPYETKYVKFNISIDSLKFWNNKSSSFDCVFTTSCPLVVSGENHIKFFSVAITVAGKTITLGSEKMITFRPKPTSSSNGQVHLIDFTSYATHQIYKVVGYKY